MAQLECCPFWLRSFFATGLGQYCRLKNQECNEAMLWLVLKRRPPAKFCWLLSMLRVVLAVPAPSIDSQVGKT